MRDHCFEMIKSPFELVIFSSGDIFFTGVYYTSVTQELAGSRDLHRFNNMPLTFGLFPTAGTRAARLRPKIKNTVRCGRQR